MSWNSQEKKIELGSQHCKYLPGVKTFFPRWRSRKLKTKENPIEAPHPFLNCTDLRNSKKILKDDFRKTNFQLISLKSEHYLKGQQKAR